MTNDWMRRWLIATCVLLALVSSSLRCDRFAPDRARPAVRDVPGGFLVRPYLQLGDTPTPRRLRVLWQAGDLDAAWALEFRPRTGGPWRPADRPTWRRVAVPGVMAHRVYRVDLKDLEPGGFFAYRVRRGGEVVFTAEARAPKA